MKTEKPICRDCEKAATLAGELIAMIRVNALRGTFATATVEEIEEHMKPWIARLLEIRPMPIIPPIGEVKEVMAEKLIRERNEAQVFAQQLLALCESARPIMLGDTAHDGGSPEDDWLSDYEALCIRHAPPQS
jgi:hypothetical protein